MNELSDFQKQATALGLKKLLNHSYFDICRLDTLSELVGVKLSGPDYQALRLLHCVAWGDMSPVLRQQTKEKCLELLNLSAQEYTDVIVSSEQDVKKQIVETWLKEEATLNAKIKPPHRPWALRLFGKD